MGTNNQPPSKRARKSFKRGEDDYLPGNIVEIEMHNFMTYGHIKSRPGSRLNLVIGPNGTGKSSLVCAIAIGLAGEPQLLGRASNIGDYVKRGEESGWIKISLRGNAVGETIIITRKIDRQNRSEWQINGRTVPKRDVLDTVHKFNIQVSNLTQFLPQDRVCEFAKLTPIELLEETEKAVGDQELSGQHRALIEKSRELKRLEITVKQNEETLSKFKALNAEQEKDVERVRQRENLLQKVESMKKKLPWLKYDMRKKQYIEAKEKEKMAKRNRDEIAKLIAEQKAPIEEKKQIKKKLEAACQKLNNSISLNDKKRRDIIDTENRLSVQVRAKANEIEEVNKREESRQERIARAKEELAAAESDLAKLPAYEPPKEELEGLGARIRELEISAGEKRSLKKEKGYMLEQERSTLNRCINRMKDIENTNIRLLQALKDSGARHIFEAVEWVKSNSSNFKNKVYGPVLVEVNVSNKGHAAYLEGHVPNYIWKSFITQDSFDRDLLVKNLKQFDIPVLNYTGNREMRRAPTPVSDEMRSLGIASRLDEVFEAPSAVKEVLISQFALDHSFIGSEVTNRRADEANKLGVMDLWTPENHYRWSISRYGGHVSASVNPVQGSRLFASNVDVREVNELNHRRSEAEEHIEKLDEELKRISSEQRHLEDEAAKLHRKREEIVNTVRLERRKQQEMANRIDQRRRKLESMEKEEDMETTISKLTDLMVQLNLQRFRKAIEMKDLLIEVLSLKRRFAEQQLTTVELDMKIRDMERELKEPERRGIVAQQEFDRCKDDVEHCRRQLQIVKDAAESVAKLNTELQRAFHEMPDTVEELEGAIQDYTAQANAVLFLNHNVLEEYERRCEQIHNLDLKVEEDRAVLNRNLGEINSLKETWLPTLRSLVTRINETFSHNFQEMAVAGEVTLDEHDMDFDKYGILIKVKFRQTGQLQVLSAHHQSGGERSVSTILYLVSLQDLTHCPFRVVDEINQGMDPINERNMFQQLVRAASQPNTPQCFLLTPKLLPDLDYTDACSILNIMNGPWIEKTSKVWSNGANWGTVTEMLSQHST
jgi:chromosome segregation ATPase